MFVWEVIVLLILMDSLFKISVLCSVWEVIVLLILMESLFKLSVLCSVWEVIVLLILTTHSLKFLFYVQCGEWLFLLILMDSLFKLSVLCSVWEVIVLLILIELFNLYFHNMILFPACKSKETNRCNVGCGGRWGTDHLR
jgi:hypothetical protein